MSRFGLARLIAIAAGVALVAACASARKPDSDPGPVAETASGVKEAVAGPFRDLNIVKDKIPPVLLAAERDPYGLSRVRTCRGVEREIAALDLALGPDIDLPQPARRPWTAALAAAPGAAVDAAIHVGTSLPVRSVARQVSGAARAEDHHKAAVQAGEMRRAFLKGIGARLGCRWPAVPIALYRAPKPHRARRAHLKHAAAPKSRTVRLSREGAQVATAGQSRQP